MKKLSSFLFAALCFLSVTNQARAGVHDSVIGKWHFHHRALQSIYPQERWILTGIEFFPEGRCSILNQPSSDSCEWAQDASLVEIKTYGDNGIQKMTWRGSLQNKNLLEGTGLVGDVPAFKMNLLRNLSKVPADAVLEVRSVLGFWGLQYKKGDGPWVSFRIYFSQGGTCQIVEPFESCTWNQNLKELQVSFKASKGEAPLLFHASPLDTKRSFQGKIVDSFSTKKPLGVFHLNSM